MTQPIPTENPVLDKTFFVEAFRRHLLETMGKNSAVTTPRDWFHVAAHAVRDVLAKNWVETSARYHQQDEKRVYYLSLEFLMGRALSNSALNLGIFDAWCEALGEFGVRQETIAEMEADPGLGNGGLGRLAACFLDSMASLNYAGYGYGIRYEYGIFYQRMDQNWQLEYPDNWLRYGNPWEFPRPEVLYEVRYGGRVISQTQPDGHAGFRWTDTENVMAMAYDTPVPGYATDTTNTLRLWAAKASRDFNLKDFNAGNYLKAVEEKNNSENLSKVLYPDDSTSEGKILRLRQEYFFVSATIQDILRRYQGGHKDLKNFPDKVAIQLNDTHPALAIPELMYLLMDRKYLSWDEAWDICSRTFSYTNHTLLPEALEVWPVAFFEEMLPRHLQIIYEINQRFLKQVSAAYPGDEDRLRRMSLIGEEGVRHVRMAHLAIVGSHKVNGVAALHTRLMKETIFADFEALRPGLLVNKTNGITPRRWLNEANPHLSRFLQQYIGSTWLTDLTQLQKLVPLAEEEDFRTGFSRIKSRNKLRLAEFIQNCSGVMVNPDSLFDVQVKRIHEYKRQLLNILHVITRYNRIRANPEAEIVSRTVIFAGKAAPAYFMAKLIIKLIGSVADKVNNDPLVGNKLKVVFLPNYDVSNALRIMPAADLSEQISTAGMEASGTGNMKLSLNGALTIGTLDGANVEIREEVGEENIFIFGLNADEVSRLRQGGYNPLDYYHANPELQQVLGMLRDNYFCPQQSGLFHPVVDSLLLQGDYYCLLADYADYIACQERVDILYRQPQEWSRRSILNVARMGKFSSDRTIHEYAREIWGIKPVEPASAC